MDGRTPEGGCQAQPPRRAGDSAPRPGGSCRLVRDRRALRPLSGRQSTVKVPMTTTSSFCKHPSEKQAATPARSPRSPIRQNGEDNHLKDSTRVATVHERAAPGGAPQDVREGDTAPGIQDGRGGHWEQDRAPRPPAAPLTPLQGARPPPAPAGRPPGLRCSSPSACGPPDTTSPAAPRGRGSGEDRRPAGESQGAETSGLDGQNAVGRGGPGVPQLAGGAPAQTQHRWR